MLELTVIGFGNSLLQDDGFGPAVVEELASRVDDERIEILACGTLTPELAAKLASTRRVIFVDACATLLPGEVTIQAVSRDGQPNVSLVHFLSPEALLVWTERLYGRVPDAELWLVGTEQTGLCEGLSATVSARVGEFVDALVERVESLLHNA